MMYKTRRAWTPIADILTMPHNASPTSFVGRHRPCWANAFVDVIVLSIGLANHNTALSMIVSMWCFASE